jgi:hypothetical protein
MKKIKTISIAISLILTTFVASVCILSSSNGSSGYVLAQDTVNRQLYKVHPNPTTCHADWQESSVVVGQTIHANFVWFNAFYNPNQGFYATMSIWDPDNIQRAIYTESFQSSGSHTLSITADKAGVWRANIFVYTGFSSHITDEDIVTVYPIQTYGSADWQESSANVGQTIHAYFTWTNAHWKPNPYDCYSDMYIKSPTGAVRVEFLGEQSSGSHILSFTADMAGIWLAEIKVWDGSNWLTYSDCITVSSSLQLSHSN